MEKLLSTVTFAAFSPALLDSYGDITSTAKDLLRYAEMNYDEELPYLAVCHQEYANNGFLYTHLLDVDMGLGWWIGKKENLILHGGDTAAFSSVLVADKKYKMATVVLSNYLAYLSVCNGLTHCKH